MDREEPVNRLKQAFKELSKRYGDEDSEWYQGFLAGYGQAISTLQSFEKKDGGDND